MPNGHQDLSRMDKKERKPEGVKQKVEKKLNLE